MTEEHENALRRRHEHLRWKAFVPWAKLERTALECLLDGLPLRKSARKALRKRADWLTARVLIANYELSDPRRYDAVELRALESVLKEYEQP